MVMLNNNNLFIFSLGGQHKHPVLTTLKCNQFLTRQGELVCLRAACLHTKQLWSDHIVYLELCYMTSKFTLF